MPDLLGDADLTRSSVVANCRMNRERGLTGSNGYAVEVGFAPLDFLRARVATHGRAVAWLDLCCGSARALVEAARMGSSEPITIVGVDLVDGFLPTGRDLPNLTLVTASLSTWEPARSFDLITCVHGLHYIGDKLGLLTRAASWLTADGLVAASLDLNNLRLESGQTAPRQFAASLRRAGLTYDSRHRLVGCEGQRSIPLPYRYLGADDAAGPNWTGQPAVNSWYECDQ